MVESTAAIGQCPRCGRLQNGDGWPYCTGTRGHWHGATPWVIVTVVAKREGS